MKSSSVLESPASTGALPTTQGSENIPKWDLQAFTWGMAELQKDKMIAETVNLLMKYLEVHSQTFEASVSIYKKKLPKNIQDNFVYDFLLYIDYTYYISCYKYCISYYIIQYSK